MKMKHILIVFLLFLTSCTKEADILRPAEGSAAELPPSINSLPPENSQQLVKNSLMATSSARVGTPVMIMVSDDDAQTGSLNYTPSKPGFVDLSLHFSGSQLADNIRIFASPYSTAIGFIGDSITQRTYNTGRGNFPVHPDTAEYEISRLGLGFSTINRGVSGSTTTDWMNGLLAPAIDAFSATGVEVVQIMLGTNDSSLQPNGDSGDPGTAPTEFKLNLEEMIADLRAAGVKRIILNEPPFRKAMPPVNSITYTRIDANIKAYCDVLDELANGRDVLRGSVDTYSFFKSNPDLMRDGVHPNIPEGLTALGELWFDAYYALLVAPYDNPEHGFDEIDFYHPEGTATALTHTSAVDARAFAHYVTVDGEPLSEREDYSAEGVARTTIRLPSDYLNRLSVGEHTLCVYFLGTGETGTVVLSDTFTIAEISH